ncbi:Leucine-rich repeat and guanylate kinase domain-containing protein, related [Eimeria praecox]|uniref:Leucine-rich repeat and guanylate kinase domain-containing protein, related n=1 Tax=Eimeria praecox TaxID=51316 RepID=U6G687_9EIME|nr:Leucine-rich repeat and guanylate kinase domain-containing protein, related [Eimeria praecox]
MARGRKPKEGGDSAAVSEAVGTPLRGELLHKALGDVSRTADGSGYAFTRLTCCGKGVTTLPTALQLYVHLRYIDISNNKIRDLAAFSRLPYLLTLNASGNNIEDISCLSSPEALPYLFLLNLSSNKISKPPQLGLQRLTRLALDANPITTLEGFVQPPLLTHLSLRGTPLETLDSLPPSDTITSLYLSHTPMQQLRQLQRLPQIKTLDLEGVPLPPDQLHILVLLPKLRELSLSSPEQYADEEHFRAEILGVLPRLQWINGRVVTPEELKAARALREASAQQEKELGQQSNEQQQEGEETIES